MFFDIHDASGDSIDTIVFLGVVVAVEKRGPSYLTLVYSDGRHVNLLAEGDEWRIVEDGIPRA